MAVEMAASENPTTSIEDGFDLAIHSGDLSDSTLVARRFAQTMTIFVATPQYLSRHGAPESPEDLHRFRAVVFVERGSVQRGALGLDKTRSVLSPPMRQRGSSPRNSEKVLFYVFSLRLNEQCQSLPCGLPAAGCPPKFASLSSTWRRLSRFVLSSIRDLAKTAAGALHG
jgi:hypothetical protein